MAADREENTARMLEMVSDVAEHVGGDYVVHGQLFIGLFEDLSLANQNKWLKYMEAWADELKDPTDIRNY